MGEGKDRTKILLLLTSTAGGVGLHAYYLARFLSKSRYDLTVGFGPGYPLDEEIASLDVPVVHFSLSRKISPLTNLKGFCEVLSFLRKGAYDIVCMECSIAGFVGRVAGWLAGVPERVFVIQLHASHPNQSRFKQVFYRTIERGLDRLTTHYVAVSEAMKRFGVDHRMMRSDKVSVIYNGIALNGAMAAPRDEVRASLGLRRDSLVVGTLARLEPQKGLQYLLRAAALLNDHFVNVDYCIAGEGPLRDELESLARDLGMAERVKFVGWQRDVFRFLSCVDIFCLPSLWESFGIAFAEAMAMERPVVATLVDGIPEVVADGETGILVNPRDPQAIADALARLLSDPDLRQRMGRAGRRRVETLFGVEEMVGRYDRLFGKLAARSKERAG